MNDEHNNTPEPPSDENVPPEGPVTERLPHTSVGARLPENIGSGVFCTGVIVHQGQNEFVLDFIQRMGRPHRVGARVVLSPRIMEQLVKALRSNVDKYEQSFGPPKEMPRPKIQQRLSLKEMYDDLRLADEQAAGAYATGVKIGHSPAEFIFDFIANFYPRATVSSRIYLSSSQVPRTLDTLETSLKTFRERSEKGEDGETSPGDDAAPPNGDVDG